jgi:hypothetical protein
MVGLPVLGHCWRSRSYDMPVREWLKKKLFTPAAK